VGQAAQGRGLRFFSQPDSLPKNEGGEEVMLAFKIAAAVGFLLWFGWHVFLAERPWS